MKGIILKSLIGSVLIFTAICSYAKCGPGGIQVLSTNTSISANSIIVVEFYGYAREYVPRLNKKYPVYLRSGNEKIPMKVTEILEGEFMIIQVVLQLTAIPKPGMSYELQIENKPSYFWDLNRYNAKSGKWEAIPFEAKPADITSKPIFKGLPTEAKKTMMAYGCGPARWVYFNIDHKGQDGTLVKAKVRNTVTGKITEFYMAIENGMAKIGHGMCSGAFHFDGKQFAVSFSLTDISGQQSEQTKEILFETPTKFTDGE